MARYDLNLLLNINDDTLGGRLSAARDAAGIDLSTLALLAGVPVQSLKAWEADRCEADPHGLADVAEALGVCGTWLATGEGAGPDEDRASGSMIPVMRQELTRLMKMYEETGSMIEKLHQRIDDLEQRRAS
ncbi:helix-turn-helix domain-containing protein [Rhizobium paknamense]|uniref:Transcriptional regulator with XRE-family HTH domain n=1 Tax=Rhizobium paknamense TaxID=1206817 RepID=A0ABU0ICQ6_9HYPH|nr:helix-turn-helix transcriptional regulator [Rhizobium paknamense]MDQ0456016.1 transcriptional regulator with XRE-family HTH domain [Rhizobium paknamense]